MDGLPAIFVSGDIFNPATSDDRGFEEEEHFRKRSLLASAQPARIGQLRGLGGLPTNKQKDFLYRKALLAKERQSRFIVK